MIFQIFADHVLLLFEFALKVSQVIFIKKCQKKTKKERKKRGRAPCTTPYIADDIRSSKYFLFFLSFQTFFFWFRIIIKYFDWAKADNVGKSNQILMSSIKYTRCHLAHLMSNACDNSGCVTDVWIGHFPLAWVVIVLGGSPVANLNIVWCDVGLE